MSIRAFSLGIFFVSQLIAANSASAQSSHRWSRDSVTVCNQRTDMKTDSVAVVFARPGTGRQRSNVSYYTTGWYQIPAGTCSGGMNGTTRVPAITTQRNDQIHAVYVMGGSWQGPGTRGKTCVISNGQPFSSEWRTQPLVSSCPQGWSAQSFLLLTPEQPPSSTPVSTLRIVTTGRQGSLTASIR